MAKLLIVDDDELSARFFGEVLTSMGHQVAAIGSATHAFDAIAHDTPDLILMDLEMPDMNGVEATRQLKSNPVTQDIPVVILTAHPEAQAFEEVSMAGADGYLNKQSDRPAIEAAINTALSGS
ncbi:MAG: response regulator [Rhodospirillales bacterium]